MRKITEHINKLTGIRRDYILHLGVCLASTSIIGILSFFVVNHFLGYTPGLVASIFGAVFALGLGVGKESGDRNNPNSGWSWGGFGGRWAGDSGWDFNQSVDINIINNIYEFNTKNWH